VIKKPAVRKLSFKKPSFRKPCFKKPCFKKTLLATVAVGFSTHISASWSEENFVKIFAANDVDAAQECQRQRLMYMMRVGREEVLLLKRAEMRPAGQRGAIVACQDILERYTHAYDNPAD
jgi:hypothetical protein